MVNGVIFDLKLIKSLDGQIDLKKEKKRKESANTNYST